MSRENEFGLIVLKPDGVRKGLLDTLLQRVQERGMEVVKITHRLLTREAVLTYYATPFDRNLYADYLTSGEVAAVLVQGPYAGDVMYRLKKSFRHEFGYASGDMENLVHSADHGNEYGQQLRLLFPELDPFLYSSYADMALVLPDDEEARVNELLRLEASTHLSRVALLYRPGQTDRSVEAYRERSQGQMHVLIGWKHSVIWKGKKVELIGYFPESVQQVPKWPTDLLTQADPSAFVSFMKEHGGIVALGYHPRGQLASQDAHDFKVAGLSAALVYDLRWDLDVVEELEEVVEDAGLAFTGGTNGQAAGGTLAMSRKMYESLLRVFPSTVPTQ